MLDVAIIGCGVVGAAAAYELSHYPLHAAIFEAENDVADCTTKANSAILHAGYDPEPGTRMARLNVEGVALAKEICARFACITNKFRAVADSHMQVMAASLMTEQDVVLFVSYSGATRDLMETLRTAKANGAKIILITHYEDSPGAKLADIVLLCGAQESPLDSGSIPIKVAVLYVAEVLVLRYILDDKPGSTEAQEHTTEALAVKML